MDDNLKETWNCKTCRDKRMHIARNCNGQFNSTTIILSPSVYYTECPISKVRNNSCSVVYSLIKSTLLAEFASFKPSELLNELNIYFIYKDTIAQAESDFKQQGNNNG